MAGSNLKFVPRIRRAVARHRPGMRALIGVLALLVILDPVLFDRSIVHLLVWHSVIFLILLLALLMVESAQDASFDERAQPRAPRFVPALGFKALTPLYDGVVKATTREGLFKQTLIAQANIQPGQHVLDLACGTGTLAVQMAQFQPLAQITGVDGDPEVLARARKKVERAGVRVRLDHANATALPSGAGQFDRVMTSLFFHHLDWPDKQRAASEILRVLKPGGELHMADWGRPANRLMRWLFFPVQVLDGFANTRSHVAGQLVELFQQAGFQAVVERGRISTMFGTLSLYSAARPH
jgi:ubiquinone/menaquinone biosynthesis C-methylase UbiE